jgi:hypothetical protein
LYISFELPFAYLTFVYISATSFSKPVIISDNSRDLLSAYVSVQMYLLLDGLELHLRKLHLRRRWWRLGRGLLRLSTK